MVAIRGVLLATRDAILTNAELLKLVDAAYPFGEREHHPYKVWLSERRKLIDSLTNPARIERVCPACGARRGAPCIEIGLEPETLSNVMHEARLMPVQQSGTGPLFDRVTRGT